MGTTGVIFAAIAVAWLAYLVPHFVRRRDDDPVEQADPAERFSDSVRIVERGTAPLLDQDLEVIDEFEVSTPLTRRAAVHDLRRLEWLAATRRRRVLLGLLAVLSLAVGVAAVDLVPTWAVAVPGGLLVGFFIVSRLSVIRMRRSLDRRYAKISLGDAESTVFLARAAEPESAGQPATTSERSGPGGLWDPVPITMPTYVSKPLAPRTVRTIDLSGPPVTAAVADPPVTADAPESATTAPRDEQADGDDSGERESASA